MKTPGKFAQEAFLTWWGGKPSIHARMGFDQGFAAGFAAGAEAQRESDARLFAIREGGKPAYPNAYSNDIRANPLVTPPKGET